MVSALVSKYFGSSQLIHTYATYTIKTNCMKIEIFDTKMCSIMHDFSRKMFLVLYSITDPISLPDCL